MGAGLAERDNSSIHDEQTWADPHSPPSSSDHDASIPQHIGPFRVIRTIASGGMGVVYEALREQPQQSVAIKLLRHSINSTIQRERFSREAEFLATLHHPSIAQLYDVGMHDTGAESMPYFVMELVESGRSITRHVHDERLPMRDRVELFISVCDAIHHGHTKGVLHRDLKPDNILVDGHGQVKVIDFGVAKALTSDSDAARYTSTGQLVGTVHYMSPEQVEGASAQLDERSDVYSLGVVLYEVLTGRLPYIFTKSSIVDAARVIRDTVPTRPSRYVPALKGDLDSILLKALSKRRDSRYASAEEFRDDLNRYLNNKALTTKHTASFYRVRHAADRFMLRHPISAALVSLLLAGLIAEFVGVPLIYKWTPAHRSYLSQLSALVPLTQSIESFDHVRVIEITDKTVELVPALASEVGASNVDPSDWKSMRVLHGSLMKRLAEAGVRVLAWDIRFPDHQPAFDDSFVDGLQAMERAGTPVIIAVPTWTFDEDGYPPISPVILPHVRWGCTSAFFDADAPWEIELAIYRPTGQTIPSLDLNVVAAWWHPQWNPASVFDPNEAPVMRLDFFQPIDGNDLLRKSLGKSRRITLSSNWLVDEDDAEFGIFKGDFIGYYGFPLGTENTLRDSTISYEWAMRAPLEELQDRLRGKVVMIGDFRTSNDEEYFPTPEGRVVHGCHGHASAIEALLQGSVVLDERVSIARFGIALLAVLGLMIAWIGSGRPATRVVMLLLLMVLLVTASYIFYRAAHYIFNPIVPFLAAALAAEIGARIIRLRQSYYA